MELYEYTLHGLKEKLDKKEVSVMDVTKLYLDRIKTVDEKVQSYITVSEDEALKESERVQKLYDSGEVQGEIAGLPLAIKDLICTEGIKTTCASHMLQDFIPPYDATVIENIKKNNGIILGKLNMDEFAMGASTEYSAFFPTKNPWDLERVPGGSSGGSAAAVSADLAGATLGSDTGGSIRQPSSLCSVVGLKPTYGLVSRYGLIAFASSLDQIGPITKDVEDAATMLNVIAGHDAKDSTSINVPKKDYKKSLINDVKGLKIAIPKEYFAEGLEPEVRQAVLDAIEVYKKLGAVVEEISLDMTKYALPVYYIIACAEASSNLGRFDGIRYGHRASEFADLTELYAQSRSEGFGQEVKRRIMLGTYVLSSGYYDAYYKKAGQVRTLVKQGFEKAFEKYDVILSPVSPTTAFKIGEKSNDPLKMYLADICTVSANIAGIPGISIPCGFDKNGLPIGLQLMAKHLNEETLFRAAYTFEQNTEWNKRKPKL